MNKVLGSLLSIMPIDPRPSLVYRDPDKTPYAKYYGMKKDVVKRNTFQSPYRLLPSATATTVVKKRKLVG